MLWKCLVPGFLACCADQDKETRSHQQAIRNLPNPSGPEGGVVLLWLGLFFPMLSWHEFRKSPTPLYFFRVISFDSLCCGVCVTGVFRDERCFVSAILYFCCLNLFLSTDICTGVINRLNCPNRDSSPLLLQNTACVPVATAYTPKLQLVQSVLH